MSLGLVDSLPHSLSQEELAGEKMELMCCLTRSCCPGTLTHAGTLWPGSPREQGGGSRAPQCTHPPGAPGGGLAQPTHPSQGAGSPARAAVGSLLPHTPAGSSLLPPGGPAAMPGPAAPRGSGSRQGPPACMEKACYQARAALPAPMLALAAGPRPRTSPASDMAVPAPAAPVTLTCAPARGQPHGSCSPGCLLRSGPAPAPAAAAASHHPAPRSGQAKGETWLRPPDQTWGSPPGLWVQHEGPRKGV